MPRTNRPRSKTTHLHWQPLADGTWAGHWKPSPRLREAGWTNRKLGTSDQEADVLAAAIALNQQVAEWDRGHAAAAAERAAPRRYRFSDLVAEYRLGSEYREGIAPATRREYDVRLRQLEEWAVGPDGRSIFVDQLDQQMVRDLRDAYIADRRNVFKCAALLRVLRLLLNWGKPRIVAVNATDGVPIPTPPSRTLKLDWRSVETLAVGCKDPVASLALPVAFWSMQRRDDLRQFNRFQWRELHGADPRDLPALVNAKGEVWGFRLQQHKTGRTVDCPMPPFLHDRILAAFEQSQWLFPNSVDPAKPVSGDVLRRKVKPVLVAGGFPDHQLRDLRRSGMSGVKDMGAMKSDVFAISGHPLDGQQRTMADVYMPPDTMAACRAIAAACRTIAAMKAREEAK